MAWTQGNISMAKKIALGFLGLGAVFDFGAFFITVYMLENFSHLVSEGNALMAFMFETFGYGLVFVSMVLFWIGIFVLIRYYGKWFGVRWQLLFIVVIAIPVVWLTFMDFSSNVFVMASTLIN